MTREEEILEAAKEFIFDDKPETSDFFDKVMIDCFWSGAKWADENPKEGLVSIDRVCEYLESLVYQEFGGGPIERTFSDEDIEEFKKAMEE